jgi:hypothetical protein
MIATCYQATALAAGIMIGGVVAAVCIFVSSLFR